MLERCQVVLVGTSNPENLGGVARLLENFAVASLALVAPRCRPEDPRALVVGRMARRALESAQVAGTLDEAVRDASCVIGFSARRGSARPMIGLRALPVLLSERATAGRIALVFGPEDNGLDSNDVERCDLVAAIELPGALPSLNLTQAVAIVLWELARPTDLATPARSVGATRAELEALLDHATAALEASGYLRGDDRERKRVHLRRILAAAGLASDDVRALHGLCAQLLRALV